jgi:carbamoyltransferase
VGSHRIWCFIARGNKIEWLDYVMPTHSSCWWYNEVASALFDTGIIGAGKVMGLAPYGAPGTIGDRKMGDIADLSQLFEISSQKDNHILVDANGRKLNGPLRSNVQILMERQLTDILWHLYEVAVEKGVQPNICLGGGGTLNSVANQVAFRQSKFKRIFMHPASGDDGTAIGAAMWYWFDQLNNDRISFKNSEIMYSVRSYEDCIDKTLDLPEYRELIEIERTEDYVERTARYIADNKIIAWYQGPSEVGPRALGNRSILANPGNAQMKDVLNSRVKFREGFRPFAPSVMNEHAEEWFGLKDSPFMLRVCDVLQKGIPAVSHVDETARIQTVCAEDNANFHRLIDCFYHITGIPLVINTSFNIKGESIVETPQDAVNCLLETDIDYLVFKNTIVKKTSRAN